MTHNEKNNSKLFSKRDILFFIIFLLCFLFIFKDFFFTKSVFFERDSTIIEIPTRTLCVKLLKEGNFALWTDSYGNGQPFLANPKNAVFYPSTLFYLFLPFFLAFKLHYFIHIVLGWLGIFYLCKSYSLSEKASFFGATIFIFSGIFLSSFEFYNHIATLCWMPWILLALQRYSKKIFPGLFMLSILWALLILAGTPYVIIITLIFGLAQSVLVTKKRKKRIILLAFSLLIAFLISSAQVIPSIELLLNRNQESENPTVWSLEIIQLFNIVFPNILGNDREPGHNDYWGGHFFDKGYPLYYSLYLGFGVFILFFLGLKRPFDTRHFILILTFSIFLLLAFGKHSPFCLLFKFVPPFSALRYPVKYIMGAMFSLAIIAGIGFDNVFTLEKFNKKHIIAILSLPFIFIFLFLVFGNHLLSLLAKFFVIENKQSVSELGNSFWQGFLLFGLCAIIVFLNSVFSSKNNLFSWILLLVIILNLGIMNRNINPTVSISFFDKPLFLKSLKTPPKIYREDYHPYYLRKETGSSFKVQNYYRQSLYPFCGLEDGIHYLYNWDFYGLYNSEYSRLKEYLRHCQREDFIKILSASGCSYYVGHHPLPNIPSQVKNIEGYSVHFQKISEQPDSVYLVCNSIKAESIQDKIEIFLNKDFNPSETAIVEADFNLRNDHALEKRDKIIVKEESHGKGMYLITSSQKAIVVFPGNYHPGWKAWIDNEKTEIFKVNLSSKGIIIPSGRHEVEIRYFPASFLYGCIVSILSLLMIVVIFILHEIISARKKFYAKSKEK